MSVLQKFIIEPMDLENSYFKVAKRIIIRPSKELLKKRLHGAIDSATHKAWEVIYFTGFSFPSSG